MRRRIRNYLLLLRPVQWNKNLILLAGVIFSRNVFKIDLLLRSIEALGIFCLLSGTVYAINDIADLEQDRKHPEKQKRPLASGEISIGEGLIVALISGCLGIMLASRLGKGFLAVSAIYLGLSLAYSFALKHVVVLDVMVIAIGFVLRAMAGVEALKSIDPAVLMSPWLLVCTLFLALFLGFNKRRHEITLLAQDASLHRATLDQYSIEFLDAMIAVVSASTVIAYSIYTIWPATVEKFNTDKMIYTLPFVVFGLFRYMYLVLIGNKGGSPSEILLEDIPLVVDILLWLIVAGLVIYSPWSK